MSDEFDYSLNTLAEGSEPIYNIRHRCFFFSKELIVFIKQSQIEKLYFSVYDQLLRSGTSIGANVVEGKAGSSKKDWINYYLIALKSANESKYWLCLIRDTIDINNKGINILIKEADEISKIIASIIVNAKVNKT